MDGANALSNIRQYASSSKALRDVSMDFEASDTSSRLDSTISELRGRVLEQQAALDKIRASASTSLEDAAYASSDPRQKLKQLRIVKEAYARLLPTTPYLPSKGSMLPALLAARTIAESINGTKEAITTTQSELDRTTTLLRTEQRNLHDAHLITAAMQARITRLQTDQVDRSQKSPAQLAKELVQVKQAQKQDLNEQIQIYGNAMNQFLNDHLGAMLAAEELGGPVVGDMLDPDNDTLAAGFTAKGKPKSTKKPVADGKRQRRIDQIWGKSSQAAGGEEEEPITEAEAADEEMRNLIERLFATLTGPGGGKAYYELERDSAASRFLVRAKIAQFHPRDARKIRLVDFGRELDD
ncbi:hypothetical protein P154DRAFT_516562 [Amniculicola lignicola CBS 123094]|uniref:Centromere protein Cenp-K n=1 Tax=Amniculicola lignicola CBS 123094 TaxID=1392246 RepID=A0A6A5X465_9PLEO|nr:hypothetical protein P154DRAFT_516562 [Amniculicola lignicola CBS 123094]